MTSSLLQLGTLFLYGVRVGVRPWPGRRDDLGGLRTPPVVLRAACILGAPLLLPTICFHFWLFRSGG